MLNYRLHRTITGEPLALPVYAPGSWRDSMTAVGSGTHRLHIPMVSRFTPDQWQDATRHWWSMLAVCWGDHPLYFGVIANKQWDYTRHSLNLKTVTVDDFFANRYTFGTANYHDGDFEITAKSMRAALTATLQRGTAWSPQWQLPFLYDVSASEAGDFSKRWERHDWAKISDIITLIRRMDGGPDLAFIPTYVDGWARWQVMTGNPKRIDGPTIDLPLSVRKPIAADPVRDEVGSRMLSGAFTQGEGMGADRKFGTSAGAGITGPPMPVRDAARSVTSIDDTTLLTSMAVGDLREHRPPTVQHGFSIVHEPGAFDVSSLHLGTRFSLRHSGDGYTNPFSSTEYVVALSHDASSPEVFVPEVQAI